MNAAVTVEEIQKNLGLIFLEMVSRFTRPQDWFPDFKGNAVIVDTETTGLNYADGARIVQIGICFVHKGKVDKKQALDITIQTPYDPETWCAVYHEKHPQHVRFREILRGMGFNWEDFIPIIDEHSGSILAANHPNIPEVIQDGRNKHGKRIFQTACDATGITADVSMRNGLPREAVIRHVKDLLAESRDSNYVFIGHNVARFDIPMILAEIADQTGDDQFELDDNNLLDTGIMVKAAQAGAFPKEHESNWDFVRRVADMHLSVAWSLDDFCVPKFGLDFKYGVDPAEQHLSAAYDCWVTACLVDSIYKDCLNV